MRSVVGRLHLDIRQDEQGAGLKLQNFGARAKEIDLLSTLDSWELAEFEDAVSAKTYDAGQALIEQGALADGCHFLLSGSAEVVTKLPGGGETLIAEVGSGNIIGEMALINGAPRSASVRAREPVETVFIDRRYFRASLDQLRPSAIKVLKRMAVILAERLRLQHDRIHAYLGMARDDGARASPTPLDDRKPGCDFDHRAFMAVLPAFRDFRAADLDRLHALLPVFDFGAGVRLFDRGARSEHAMIVLRGAVDGCLLQDDQYHCITVLGPGTFCGLGPLMDGGPHSLSAVTNERATCLVLSHDDLMELTARADQTTLSLLNVICEDLVVAVSRAGNHMTRLTGLTRIHDQLADGAPVSL
jgi:CRP-like cAMP-binding protein